MAKNLFQLIYYLHHGKMYLFIFFLFFIIILYIDFIQFSYTFSNESSELTRIWTQSVSFLFHDYNHYCTIYIWILLLIRLIDSIHISLFYCHASQFKRKKLLCCFYKLYYYIRWYTFDLRLFTQRFDWNFFFSMVLK